MSDTSQVISDESVVGDADAASDDCDGQSDDVSYFENLQQENYFNAEKNVGGEIDLQTEMLNVDSSVKWQLCSGQDVGKILLVK